MKIVILVDKSAGNDSVGQMWTETYLFNLDSTLEEVLLKIQSYKLENLTTLSDTVRIQIAQEKDGE